MALTTLNIKEPGLNVLPPGVERHVVNAGGLTGLQIFPDDEIEIINNEGNQICEIICFDKDGKSELGILNQKENGKINFIKEILNKKDESSLITNLQLKKRNLDINKSKSSFLFEDKTPSGEKIKIKSKDKCYVIFSAPQNEMLVSEQNPSSDLTILKLIASGGISKFDELPKLKALGCEGVIIGKAIYENRISLKEIERFIINN